MKKTAKLSICLLLCISMVASLVSCGLISVNKDERPAGYTGGFPNEPHFYHNFKIYWVETFEEAMIIIDSLIACGNDLNPDIISSYETEEVDAKYCFKVSTNGMKSLKDGEKWYERKYNSTVSCDYYGFLDEVSITEIEYSDVDSYRFLAPSLWYLSKIEDYDLSKGFRIDCEVGDKDHEIKGSPCHIVTAETGMYIGKIGYSSIDNHLEELPDNFHDEFLASLVFIGI